MLIHKKLLAPLCISVTTLLASASVLAEPVVLELNYEIPVQQNQVAFVPFAGDSVLSPIILNDLSKTELKVTS
ncbi:MAG: translocation protein TolB, partial [Psychrobacter celer]